MTPQFDLNKIKGMPAMRSFQEVHRLARSWNLDSFQTTFFLRQLEYIMPKTFDVIFAELKAPKMIPVSSEGGNGVEKITWRSYTMLAQAQFIANYGKDFLISDVAGDEFTNTVKSIGNAYQYTIQDIRAAQQGNIPLEQMRANSAARGVLQLENTTAFFGDIPHNIQGWFNNGNIPVTIAPADGFHGLSVFTDKSPDQMIRDVANMINGIPVLTKEVEKPNTVLLAPSTMALLRQTMSNLAANSSVFQWLAMNHPWITTWDTLVELETAGTGGTRRMIAYDKNPDKLSLLIPQPFEQFAPLQEGLSWTVYCHERIAGVRYPYPLSCNFTDGV